MKYICTRDQGKQIMYLHEGKERSHWFSTLNEVFREPFERTEFNLSDLRNANTSTDVTVVKEFDVSENVFDYIKENYPEFLL